MAAGERGWAARWHMAASAGARAAATHDRAETGRGSAKIAMETGGGYFELTNTGDLSSTFAPVADELHRQYALGFTPEKLDGKSHKLELRLKRPEHVARARKSYVASIDREPTTP